MSSSPVVALPSQAELRRLLDYDPQTGTLTWRARTGNNRFDRAFNTRWAGREAFTAATGNGYRHGFIYGGRYLAHRVIWVLHYGAEPEEIDHINGDRSDNRIANLRSVSRRANTRNKALSCKNRTGYHGVFWYDRYKAYQVTVAGKFVGRYATIEQAVRARRAAEQRAGFHQNHGRRQAQ